MICVTVSPESRTLAKADLLNAAGQGDIIELCLDRLIREPDFPDLLDGVKKPVIVSCRTQADGGLWQGDNDTRRTLLKQAILANPDYIELDIEMARRIPPFGETKRVISFTRLDRPEFDIDSLIDEATAVKADVVKFTWPTRTLDDAWPLLSAVTKRRAVPIVGMGLGRPELTFSLLGLKYGSPWVYAALEPGRESHAGQASVFELRDVFAAADINSKTKFIAVAGFNETQQAITRVLNDAFRQRGSSKRCLPIEVGNIEKLPKQLETLGVQVVLATGNTLSRMHAIVDEIDKRDRLSNQIDVLARKDDRWIGHNSLWRAGRKTIEKHLAATDRSLERTHVIVLGNAGCAPSLVAGLVERGGVVSVCGTDDKASQEIAADHSCRFVPYQGLYDTLADVVVIADADLEVGQSKGRVNPSFLQPAMTVFDFAAPPADHPLAIEARERKCTVVPSTEVFRVQAGIQYKAITGDELPENILNVITE